MFEIAFGHRTLSDRFPVGSDILFFVQTKCLTIEMASKRGADSTESSDIPAKKRTIQKKTIQKWISEFDKEFSTSVWLKLETKEGDRDHVALLKCSICSRFKCQLVSIKNFRATFIEGSSNVRVSSVKDHAVLDMHTRAMLLFKKSEACVPSEFSPIARALAQSSMDASTKAKIKRKFEAAYFVAKENLAFTKMRPICQLEERHGVDLGHEYQNDKSCAIFIDFIASEQQMILQKALEKAKFFSIQADASTDAGNQEIEMFLVVYLTLHPVMERCVCEISILLSETSEMRQLKGSMNP